MSDLLNEAREQVELQPEGTGKLRLLEIISSKVFNMVSNDVPLEHLISQSQRTFRIEVSLLCVSVTSSGGEGGRDVGAH